MTPHLLAILYAVIAVATGAVVALGASLIMPAPAILTVGLAWAGATLLALAFIGGASEAA